MDAVLLTDIAREFGSPAYVYSHAAMVERWQAFDRAFGSREHLICYAVKACSNLSILNLFARLGSGFDIVSLGELRRVLLAGGDVSRVVFSGVGKRHDEISYALEAGIRCFNVESASELKALAHCADRLGKVAPVALRINPDVRPDTHTHIATGTKQSKFGLPVEEAIKLYRLAAENKSLEVIGTSCHIGSQITSLQPFVEALRRTLRLIDEIESAGIDVKQINLGGGLGVTYGDEEIPSTADYVACLLETLDEHHRSGGDRNREILIEPGRALVANAGILLTRVVYLKPGSPRHFAVVDTAMNDLLRPALYAAHHRVVCAEADNASTTVGCYDVVGPVCESADFIARECTLAVDEGSLLAVLSAGAYGFSMASNYNSRPRPAEVLVQNGNARLIRERESVESLVCGEPVTWD